jgi:signal transduction histidine kinase
MSTGSKRQGIKMSADPNRVAEDDRTDILIVDDRPDKLLVYQTLLDELGQRMFTAESGERALKQILERDFAVILLDVNMPGMDGLETAALIRNRSRSAHVPIIFITADYSDEAHMTRGYSLGAVDYIASPIVPEILRAKVKVFVDLYRYAQQARRRAEERIALAEERAARVAAERMSQQWSFLAQASVALSGSLDVEAIARMLVHLCVPMVADRCTLRLGGADGDEQREFTWPEEAPSSDAAVEPFVIPLVAGGSTLGTLSLGFTASNRRFEGDMVPIATKLAGHAAIALDNARLYEKLREEDRRKDEFLAMLAHELRNPLAPISNAVHVLSADQPDPAKLVWAREVIGRQLRQLIRLVDDLLDVARITRGKIDLKIESVEVARVVAAAVETSRPTVDALQHELSVSLPPEPMRIRGDFTRVAQVLANIINNAAKYTDKGGRITVSAAREGAEVVFRIQDSGLGIPRELLSKIFEPFTQIGRTLDRAQGGLGIGLTLAQRLVEMQGGSVSAFSAGPDQGSEFTVRLPAAAATRAVEVIAPEAALRAADSPLELNVLIVDDNRDVADSTAVLLRAVGCTVHLAYDGEEAIRSAKSLHPDAVLLDIGLPKIDGYQVAERIRAEPENRKTFIVALSGYGHDEYRRLSAQAGFDCHVVKPIDPAALTDLLASRCAPKALDPGPGGPSGPKQLA